MPPSYAHELNEINLSKGAHATAAIEGNTLSEEEVAAILRRHSTTVDTDYQVREVEYVISAYNGVLDRPRLGDTLRLTPALVKQFNQQVLANLELPADVRPGEVRQHSVTVGPYRGPNWDRCDALIGQMASA